MSFVRWSRARQMWFLVFICLTLFAGVILLIPGMTWPIYWRVILTAILSAMVSGGAFEIWVRTRARRGESTTDLLNRVSAGDLSPSASQIKRSTQSERMANALRGLVANLERTIRRFAQLATDVATVSGQISGRARILARSAGEQLVSTESTSASVTQIDQSINAVRRNMEELSANAEETSTSVLEMSASIEEVSRIADQLAEFVEQTSSAIEEMSASINQVATNTESFSSFATQTASSMIEMNATTEQIGKSAKSSAELARYVKDAANEGRLAVSGTVEGMRKIHVAVDEAKAALGELADRSEEIGEIVRVIDEIAGQTNLLALNAAIIAAQAGERGKGFAVVADEIRDLSERTSVSTEEIRTLIQNVQRGVERAAEQMTMSADRVHDGVGLTGRAEQVLEKILDLTDRSTSSISEIAKATEEQSRGSAAATAAIEEVTKMVQTTASATQQQSQRSRESSFGVSDLHQMANTLSHESNLLNQELNRFTLPVANEGGSVTTATVLWQKLTFDPVFTSASALGFISKAVHMGLVRYGEAAELVPGIAERWEILEQGHLYRFHLRHNVRFHNGRALEARDVHDSFVRVLDPSLEPNNAWILRCVAGSEAVISGKS